MTELQNEFTDHSDSITVLEATMEHLSADVIKVYKKYEDLESRFRKNNLREEPRMTEFISQLYTEVCHSQRRHLLTECTECHPMS